jgi:Flp pilus assembly secretin CpaC
MPLKLALAAFVAALCVSLAAPLRADEPAAPAATKAPRVTVDMLVVEVSLTKLRALGFDWEVVKGAHQLVHADGKQLTGFLRALKEHDLAEFLCEPKLMTLSGRPASLAVGTTKLDVVPVILGSGRIQVEHRLELPHAGGVLRSHSAVELDPGQAVIAGHVRSNKKDAAGKANETATLVVLRADTKSDLAILDDAIGQSAVPATTKPETATYRELPSPRRR